MAMFLCRKSALKEGVFADEAHAMRVIDDMVKDCLQTLQQLVKSTIIDVNWNTGYHITGTIENK